MLLQDGVRYLLYKYKNEGELERIVFEHSEMMFGSDSVLFSRHRIKGGSGITSIPDAFLLSINDKKWYVLEIELASHSLYEHVVVQINKFNTAIKNPRTRSELVDIFYDEVNNNIQIKRILETTGIVSESHKFLYDTVNRDPEILVVIDRRTKELDEICESLPFQTKALKFETYYRGGIGMGAHIHSFDTLKCSGIEEPTATPEHEKETSTFIPGDFTRVKTAPARRKQSWANYCRETLESLGGRACLRDIYREVERLRNNAGEKKIRNLEAAVRNALEKNSRGNGLDIFEPEMIGSGIWLLKR